MSQNAFFSPIRIGLSSSISVLKKRFFIHHVPPARARGQGTFRHQPFGRQYGVGHMGDKSVEQMGNLELDRRHQSAFLKNASLFIMCPQRLPVTWLNTIWLNFFVESFGLKILSQVTTKLGQLHSNSRNKCQLPEIS